MVKQTDDARCRLKYFAGLCTKFRYVAEPAHFVLWLAY